MSQRTVISVFEHQQLIIGHLYQGVAFKTAHWEALAHYNETQDHRFFNIGHRSIKFQQYVGVIQVGQLTIEVLPKAERGNTANPDHWRKILLDMLRVSRHVRLEASGHANQQLRHRNLLEVFIDHFLTQVERLLHQGLVRQYRQTEGNKSSLQGSLQFGQHLQRNLVHKERFYVRHQVYDREHLLHQIIQEAVLCLIQTYPSSAFSDRLARLQLDFPEQARLKVSPQVFERITYNRKTEVYREAIELARLILLQYSPDLRSGRQHVLAILFDMNALFEDYVYQCLRKAHGAIVKRQSSKKFWGNQRLRPDIVIQKENETIVLDTKWKVLSKLRPDDADLRQLYAYQQYWGAAKGYLIYPAVDGLESMGKDFHQPEGAFWGGVWFWELGGMY
jgi:5-methylcytosine-specific restriction enzyme subunit McrC